MSDFSFAATAQCHTCGEYLDSSDEECTHPDKIVRQHLFRRINSSDVVAISATMDYKWPALKRRVDNFVEWQWLGPRASVQPMVGTVADSVENVPHRAMAHDCPKDL